MIIILIFILCIGIVYTQLSGYNIIFKNLVRISMGLLS